VDGTCSGSCPMERWLAFGSYYQRVRDFVSVSYNTEELNGSMQLQTGL
jgi:heterodisulfide reductase subunit C